MTSRCLRGVRRVSGIGRAARLATAAAIAIAALAPGSASADATQYDCYIEKYHLDFDLQPMTGSATGQCAYGGDGSLRRTTFTITGEHEQAPSRKNFPISGTVTIADGIHPLETEGFRGTVERWTTDSGAEMWMPNGSYGCSDITNYGLGCRTFYDYDASGGNFRGTNERTVQPPVLCAKVAATNGSDANSGTAASPYRTADRLWRALKPMQTGCLRNGTYDLTRDMFIEAAHVRVMSYPGEHATLRGRVVINADGVTLERLTLNGNCQAYACSRENPVINRIDDRLIDNNITNDHTGICVSVSSYRGSTPARFLIQGNRIHNCGRLPATNHDHGIYVATGYAGMIRDNAIYDNADRGVQLYPDAYSNEIVGNTIDGNGQGIITSIRSSGNRYYGNVISNSNVRFNVETDELTGTGNLVAGNCLWATHPDPYYRQNGGVQPGNGPPQILISGNTIADPLYSNRAAKDFRIPPSSPCFGRGASDAVARR